MQQDNQLILDQAINQQPLIVKPDLALPEVIHRMNQDWGRSCTLSEGASHNEQWLCPPSQPCCALVMEAGKLRGIFTQGDLVKRIATQLPLQGLTVAEAMTHPVIALSQHDVPDVFTALEVMQQHHIRHLPILNERGGLRGVITCQGIRLTLPPTDLLRLRQVEEVMDREVIHALPSASLVEITQLMAQHHSNSVVIATRGDRQGELREKIEQRGHLPPFLERGRAIAPLIPTGIITERDIIQFQLLELPLEAVQAQRVMSHPLFTIESHDSLWLAHQKMQQQQISRLVAINPQGELQGIITQAALIRALEPLRSDERVNILRLKLKTLERQDQRLLQATTAKLEEAVLVERSTGERRRQILSHVAQGVAAQMGEDFFHSLVEYLSKALEVDYAFIGELAPKGDRIRIKAIYGQGQALEHFDYDLQGTPCADVVGQQRCIYPRDVAQHFPQDLLLAEMGIEGYLGAPLSDSAGRPLGLMVILKCQPLQELELMEEVLTIFAARASGELERQRAAAEQDRFFTLSLDLLCIAGLDGYFRRINPAFERYLGFSQEELLAEPFLNFVHPDDVDKTLAEMEKLAQGKSTIAFENRYRSKKDGTYRWFLWTATPYNEEELLYATARDITERKHMEQRLSQQVAQQSALAQLSLGAISPMNLDSFMDQIVQQAAQVLDVEYCRILALTEDRDALLLKAGVGWKAGLVGHAIIGIELSSQAGYTLQESTPVVVDDLRSESRFNGPALLRDHNVISGISVIIPGKTGSFGVMGIHTTQQRNFQPDEVRFVQSVANLLSSAIEQQRSEATIREQASLLEIATDAIILYNLDHRILYWNPGAEKIYGWSAADAIGRDASELLHFAPPPELSDIERSMTEHGEWQGELSNQKTQGEKLLIVQSRWSLMRDESGQPEAILVVNTDITENKQLETQYLRAQRLESIGTLAGGIAHDLNNILTPILGISQLLSHQLTNADPQTNRLLKILQSSAERGSALVNQVLTFSRGVEGERVVVQLRHLVAEIQQIVAETFPKSIEFRSDIPKDLWPVCGDLTQLHQVLMNLSVNARDAMLTGGELTISAHNLTIDENYSRMHLEAEKGPYTVLSVTDTGSGIDPKIQEQIFDPFFTTKDQGHGTGLGLATVSSIIKSHGGFIQVASELGKGTTIEAYLPAVEVAEEAPSIPSMLKSGQGELILVVDDEAPIREITQATLESFNYRVLTAQDGIDAIALYAEHKNDIVVVIMDVMMPTMDGTVAVQTLKRMNPAVKVIMSSGLASNQAVAKGLGSSVEDFLLKPFTSETLLQKVEQVIHDKLSPSLN